MRDHIVEGVRGQLEVFDLNHLERHVRETQRLHERAAARDRSFSRVDADEARAGECKRHRHEVAAVAAAELQHPASLQRRRLNPEQGA